ncbi:hypothetical protein RIR_jg27289.t1 [Rhizophagus irregularis DAOM 181602=DAOM 197198]|nr:hypothetical protein RIR_jg27289.t1 [Rhizophagus irregularis DAOM 181602=DAOM 197198]
MWKWISKIGVFRVSNGKWKWPICFHFFLGIFLAFFISIETNKQLTLQIFTWMQLCSSGIYTCGKFDNFFLTKHHILLGSLNMWNFDGQFRKFKTTFKKKVSKLGWVLGCSEKK